MRENKIVKYSSVIIFIFACLFVLNSTAQVVVNSPYTRFGLGWLVEDRFEARLMGMGGIRYGMQDAYMVNAGNPASYSAFDSTTFVFQGGVFGQTVNLRSDDLSSTGSFISMSHLVFGFQVTKWWGTSMGVLPFSYVGYDLYNETELDSIGYTKYLYEGSGGLNQFYWGNSFRIYKGLSIGVNANYVFGTIYRERSVGFPDDLYKRNTRISTTFNSRDFYFDFGIQYKHNFKKRYNLVVGLTYGKETEIKSEADYIVTTYFGDLETTPLYPDTVDDHENIQGSFTLPNSLGVGFAFAKTDKWTIGADFSWQQWENYKAFGVTDSLNNTWGVAIGGEFIPNKNSINNYFDRVAYRLGFKYNKSYINLRDTDINEFGISFGMGFPITKSRSTLNFAIEAGRSGTTVNSLIQENYLRFTFAVNIFERWFVKSKYY